MNKVLDSSAVLHVVLPEPYQAKALQLLDDYRNGITDLLAPDIYPLENRLVKNLSRSSLSSSI